MDNESRSSNQNRASIATLFFNRLHRWINTLRVRWWVILLTVACAVGGEALLRMKAPPSYFSQGRMIVSAKLSVPSASSYNEELNNFLGTQVGLLQSDVVSNRAIARVRKEHPALPLSRVLFEVKVSPKTSIFNLRAVTTNADYAAAFVQATMGEFVALKKEMLRDASDSTRIGLQSVLSQLNSELTAAKQELIAYGASNREVYAQEQGNGAADYLAKLTRQLATLRSELRLLTSLTLDENAARLVGLVQPIASPGSGGELFDQELAQQNLARQTFAPPTTGGPLSKTSDPEIVKYTQINPRPGTVNANQGSVVASQLAKETGAKEQDPAILVGSETEYLKAKQQILLMKAQRDDLGRYLRPMHPKMIALDEDIEKMEKLLVIFRGQTKEQLAEREHALEIQIGNLEEDIRVWEAKTVEISKKMTAFQDIKERIHRLQDISDSLFASENTVDLEKTISPESVSILEAATPGRVADSPLLQDAAVAAALGLAFGVAALVFLDRLDDRPHSLVEMRDLFDEPILGQIPHVRVKEKDGKIPFLAEEDERHALAEAYRSLRSSVTLPSGAAKQSRSILITSAIPNDGKTMTAANLALILARSGERVLLVDADLRRGGIHKPFKLPATPGFAEILTEQNLWPSVVQDTPIPALRVISCGTLPRHPGELLVKPVKQKFLREAAAQYDYILLDSPPIMATDDASNLAPHVDGVLMVIRASHTSSRVARAALDLLRQRRANILGIVFNDIRVLGGDYYYYKYREYYSVTAS